jgi:transposase
MKAKVRFLGLDVHAATIAVAVAEPDGSVRSPGTMANRAESIRTLVKKPSGSRSSSFKSSKRQD